MKNWTVRKRIIVGLAILIAINVIVGLFTSLSIYRLKSYSDNIAKDQLPSLYLLGEIKAQEALIEALKLQHINATTKEDTLALENRLTDARAKVDKLMAQFQQTILDDVDKEQIEKIKNDIRASREAWLPIRELSINLKDSSALALYQKAEPLYDQLAQDIQNEVDHNKEMVDKSSSLSVSVADMTTVGVNISIFVMLVAGITVGYSIVHSLNQALSQVAESLGEGANQIVSASGQLAAASQSLAQGASEQASSLQETSTALEEISSMTKRNAESAEAARILSTETRAAAEAGVIRTEEMQTAMEAIQLASTEMAQAIQGIKTSSNDVSKIISTIDEIAFQTNILALNAAVEAARAGEAGMGFAVVAEEVRNLARRSADAAKEIAGMIEAAVNQGSLGVEVNNKVSSRIGEVVTKANGVRDSLTHILGKAREVDALINQISLASKEQNSGLLQINGAVNQMNQVTQANAANSEQTASASEELTAQSVELRTGVGALIKLVKGRYLSRKTDQVLPTAFESFKKTATPPVKAMDISPRKRTPVSSAKTNGMNGHDEDDLHDSFLDM